MSRSGAPVAGPTSGPTSGATTLFLSRHGQTVWHRENRYAGTSDIDLTPRGQTQAQALARWALTERPDVVVCSPVRRALETARPAAELLGATPVVCPPLREVFFGVAEGRTIGELDAADPDMVARFRSDPVKHPFPDAEDPAEAAGRASAALRGLAATYPGQRVLVVAHNTLLRLALCRLLGLDIARYRTVFPRLDNGSLTTVSLPADGGGQLSLLSLNVPLRLLAPGADDASTSDGATGAHQSRAPT